MKKAQSLPLIIYCDGACQGNPGPGGWAAIVAWSEGRVKELGGKNSQTTNNRMELKAALEALRELRQDLRPVVVFTDSTYLIRGITQWIWAWKNKDWKSANGNDVANQDLWEELHKVVRARGKEGAIEWKYVRGHTGNPGNERCDKIAVDFSQGRYVDLFEGSLLQYDVAVYDFPEEQELPPMKPKGEKKPAFSYLSYVNGVVKRHPDWSSCEATVKGRSGAKFKKAMSAGEELEILKSWGIDPNRLKAD